MNTVQFTDVIDMTDSSAFSQGFFDRDTGRVYLVFNNGSTVGRNVGKTFDLAKVGSWGRYWANTLRWLPNENPADNATFEQRPEAQTAAEPEPEAPREDDPIFEITWDQEAVLELLDVSIEHVVDAAHGLLDRVEGLLANFKEKI